MTNSRLEKLMEMLLLQPEDAFLLYAIGFEYEAMGEDDKAGEYYEKILATEKDYLPVYYQAGLFYARLGQTDKAIKHLEQGIALAKENKDMKTLRELNQALEEVNDQ